MSTWSADIQIGKIWRSIHGLSWPFTFKFAFKNCFESHQLESLKLVHDLMAAIAKAPVWQKLSFYRFGGSNPALSGNLILSNHQDTANNLFDKTKDATEKDSNNTNAGAIACGPNND